MQDELRSVIRQLLREELAALRDGRGAPRPGPREEIVRIDSDADLAAFVRRILAMASDTRARAEIEAGRHVFRLTTGGAGPAHLPAGGQAFARPTGGPATAAASFERGLVTEREVRSLPEGTTVVRAGKAVRFTPLAQDELRRLGIKIERAKS